MSVNPHQEASDTSTSEVAGSGLPSYPFRFNREKAVELILYLARRVKISDFIHICKILYFADKIHLERYGRFLCGDYYVAMKNGPVPSGVYDILKFRRDMGGTDFMVQEGFNVVPLRDAAPDYLSDSDHECLDRAIAQYGSMSGYYLIQESHDAAWKAADLNDIISIESIAEGLKDGAEIIEHLRNP